MAWCCRAATTWRPELRRVAAASPGGDRIRDRYEMELIDAFVKAGKPVFGVCRGFQLLNVTSAARCCRTSPPAPSLARAPSMASTSATCTDRAGAGHRLAGLYPGVVTRGTANSIHHQGIGTLAPGFTVEARCPTTASSRPSAGRGLATSRPCSGTPEFHDPSRHRHLRRPPMLQDFFDARLAAQGCRS